MTTRKIAIFLFSAVAALLLTGCVVVCCGDKAGIAGSNGGGGGVPGSDGPIPGPEHHKLPVGESPGSVPCGSFCNYVLFNNSGSGYAGADSSFVVQITDGDGGPAIPNSKYHLYWWRGPTSKGCASNLGANQKQFVSVPNGIYIFTVYFKPGHCATYADHEIYLIPSP